LPDLPLLIELMAVTASLSGYAPVPEQALPAVRVLAPAAMTREICPDNPRECVGLVAQFDADRAEIRLSTLLDLGDARGRSFLVHELVHVLQHEHRGKAPQHRCEDNLRAEQEAYAVQNAYLEKMRSSERFGRMLMSMQCARAQTDGSNFQLERGRVNEEATLHDFMERRARNP
jgi:hypothetical protein